jgi:hypothetical protein
MLNIIPHIRTFKIENIPQVKISLSKLKINRIFIPIEPNVSSQGIFQNDKIQVIKKTQ